MNSVNFLSLDELYEYRRALIELRDSYGWKIVKAGLDETVRANMRILSQKENLSQQSGDYRRGRISVFDDLILFPQQILTQVEGRIKIIEANQAVRPDPPVANNDNPSESEEQLKLVI